MYFSFPEFMYPFIIQLQIAADMMKKKNDGSSQRTAIILCDNLVELICYRSCEDLLGWFVIHEKIDRLGRGLGVDYPKVNKLSWDDWKDGHSWSFDTKLALLAKHDRISKSEQSFLLSMHRYRNELYHQGLKWTKVLSCLAVTYHRFACEMLSRLKLPYIDYLDRPKSVDGYETIFEHIEGEDWGSKLLDAFEGDWYSADETAALLSEFCVTMLGALDRDIEFIMDARSDIVNATQVINESVFDAEVPEVFRLQHDVDSEAATKRIESARKKYYKNDPRPRLYKAAAAVSREKDEIKCVIRFDTLFREVDCLNSAVRNLAERVDEAIQHQIDVMRGK
jgi:hypothetical protein